MTPDHLNPDTLSAFVDRELQSANAQAVQQHLSECSSCTLRVLSAMQLKAATARAGQRFVPAADTLSRLTAQLQPKKPVRVYSFRPAAFRPMAWGALAAALVLTVSFLGWRQTRQANALSAELLDQHLATLSSSASPQVLSTDRHTVKPWFQGKLPFSFNLPEPSALPADTALKGANLVYLNDQPAALLLFMLHKHEVSVFLTQRAGMPLSLTPRSTRSGFTIHSANTRDLCITAVSDVNPTELDALLATLVQVQ